MIALGLLLGLTAFGPLQTRELNVYAAASLKESFGAIAKRFEAANPGLQVRLEFAGSQDLAARINQGAPADVFASAAPKNLDAVAYVPESRRLFALNRLVVITPASSTKAYGLRDLARAPNIVVAAPAVPAGAYAREALAAAARRYGLAWLRSVNGHIVSEEADVRAVLTKVELGEADAGIVYASDAMAGEGKVRATAIPGEFQPRIAYPMAILKTSKRAHDAMHFMHAVLGPEGQAALTSRGFRSPLEEAHAITLNLGAIRKRLKLPLSPALPHVTLTAAGPENVKHSYTGVPLTYLFGRAEPHAVRFEGADEYSVTLPFETLKAARAILVSTAGPYAQIVVPGQPARVWVSWLTKIEAVGL